MKESLVTADRWYYRLTLNQETELEKLIGKCKGLTYQRATELVNNTKCSNSKKKELTDTIMAAATKAGCTGLGVTPLVDDTLADHLKASRFRKYG